MNTILQILAGIVTVLIVSIVWYKLGFKAGRADLEEEQRQFGGSKYGG